MFKAKFGHRPRKNQIQWFFGERGVILPSRLGFDDGCSHVEDISEDGVTHDKILYDKDSGSEDDCRENAEDVFKALVSAGKIGSKSKGDTKTEDSGNRVKIKTRFLIKTTHTHIHTYIHTYMQRVGGIILCDYI